MDFDISLPSVKGMHVPSLGTHCRFFSSFVISPANILHKGYTQLEKVRHILWKRTVETDVWISWAPYYASTTEPLATSSSKSYCVWLFTSQSTIFQLCRDGSSWVEPVLSKDHPSRTCCLCSKSPKTLQWFCKG